MKTALQATTTSVIGFVLFGVALFWPAGTFDYWQAWVYIGVYAVLGVIYSVYIGLTNPDVLRRRMKQGPTAETRPVQKIVAGGIYVIFTAVLVVSALDRRFGWSHMPTPVAVFGQVLVAVGLISTMVVVGQNNYAAATITVEAGQTVVSTGLYGIVRHPMYSGALLLLVGTPLALASFWGLLALIPVPIGLAYRILDEEKALTSELAGYREYMQDVRFRLMPYVW
jgi:protein-S-isoprenylcysteine O-methyltransferase Ste14